MSMMEAAAVRMTHTMCASLRDVALLRTLSHHGCVQVVVEALAQGTASALSGLQPTAEAHPEACACKFVDVVE